MSIKPEPTIRTHAMARPIFFVIGITCTAVGIINYFIPGMPSTVFLLIALWAFKRSSPKLEHWLLWKSPLGPVLRDWEADRSMTMRTKRVAILFVWVGIGASIGVLVAKGRPIWLPILLFVIAVALTVFLWTRKTKIELPIEA